MGLHVFSINLPVRDLEASVRFYTENFGITSWPVPGQPMLRTLDFGGIMIQLQQTQRPTQNPGIESVNLLVFVSRYEDIMSSLRGHGIEVSERTAGDGVDHGRTAMFRDLNGYGWEVAEQDPDVESLPKEDEELRNMA